MWMYHGDKQKELKDKAKTEVDCVLEKEPDNLLGLCIKTQMEEITTPTKQKRTKNKIKPLVRCELSLSHAYAIIAFYLHKLYMVGPSLELFERAIRTWERQDKGDEIKVVFWKYLLATAYRGQLNRDVHTKQQDFNPDKTMTRVKDLLRSGISLGESHKTLAARCYSKLGATYSRYKFVGHPENRTVALELAPSVLACYEKAWELCAGRDPQVIEKCAKFVKSVRHDEESKLLAAELFKQLLKMCPTRHVAAHQLGLLYRSLCLGEKTGRPIQWQWHKNVEQKDFDSFREMILKYIICPGAVRSAKYTKGVTGALKDQPERESEEQESSEVSMTQDQPERLSDDQESNEASVLQDQPKGENQENQAHKASVLQVQPEGENQEQDSIEASVLQDQPRKESEEEKSYEACNSRQDQPEGESQEEKSNKANILQDHLEKKNEEQKDKYDKENQIQNTSHAKVEMNQREYQHVPTHEYDSPKLYDSLQADNPKAESNYLELAVQYFQRAVEITNGSRARYLIDLGRAKISNGEEEDALLDFENAKCVLAKTSGRRSETAYLYEQWALLLSKQYLQSSSESDCATMSDISGNETCCNDARLNTIERYFLKSVRSSIANKSRSKVAYYELAKILEKDKSGKKWCVLYEIYQEAGQPEKAKRLLEHNDKTQPQARKLFKQQCIEDKAFDEYLNWSYTCMMYHKKPSDNLTQDIVEMTLHKAKFVLSSLENEEEWKTDEENGDAMAIETDYGDALKVCLQPELSEASTMPDQPKRDCQEKKSSEASTVQDQPEKEGQEQKSTKASTMQDQPKRERQEQKSNEASTVPDQSKREQKSSGVSTVQDQPERECQKQKSSEASTMQNQKQRKRQEQKSNEASTVPDQPKSERQELKSSEASTVQDQPERESQAQKSNGESILQDRPERESQEKKTNEASAKLDQTEGESQRQECNEANSLHNQPKGKVRNRCPKKQGIWKMSLKGKVRKQEPVMFSQEERPRDKSQKEQVLMESSLDRRMQNSKNWMKESLRVISMEDRGNNLRN